MNQRASERDEGWYCSVCDAKRPAPTRFTGAYALAPIQDQRSRIRTMSVAGLVLAIIPCYSLVGLALSIAALVKSAHDADTKTRTTAIIGTVIAALWLVATVFFVVTTFWHNLAVCREYGDACTASTR